MATTPFATVTELEGYWRTLSTDEKTRAGSLLASASDQLRLMARPTDLDDKITTDTLYQSALKSVVMEATKRSMTSPIDAPPTTEYSQVAGPYSENFKFLNPGGDLFFKKAELRLLGLRGQTVDSWTTTSSWLYEPYEQS